MRQRVSVIAQSEPAGLDIRIRAFEERDVAAFAAFRSSPDAVLAYCGTLNPESVSELWSYVQSLRGRSDQVLWTIADSENESIGFVVLHHIDWMNRTMHVGMAIYNAERRGRGLGSTARRLVLSRVFGEMNFRYVYGHYLDSNTASRRLNEKMGAGVTGTRRAVAFTDGRYRDVVCHALSREQFIQHQVAQGTLSNAR